MGALNYEIDLQCDDKIKKGWLHKGLTGITGLLVISLIIVAGVYASALLYANHLKVVIAGYESDINSLTAETKSLKTLEDINLILSQKANLEAELQPGGQPVSIMLQQVIRESAESLKISSVTVERGGIVYIVGTGTKMQSVAAYCQALENTSSVKVADITEIKLAGTNLYNFKVELRPGEVSDYEAGN